MKNTARQLEMLVERVSCSLRVVHDAGREEAFVEGPVEVLRFAGGGEERRPEPLRPIPGRADQGHEPRRLGRLVEREVEVGVRTHRLPDVAGPARLVEPLQMPPGRLGSGVREPLGAPAHGERLEREPDLKEVAQLVDVEIEHLRALMGDVLGQSQSLELADRLADRRDARPQRASQFVQAQGRPGGQLAQDDRLAQLLERVLRHRPVAHPLLRLDLSHVSHCTRTLP